MSLNAPAMTRLRFWQEIFIAAIRAGQSITYAEGAANHALNSMIKLTINKDGTVTQSVKEE